MSKPTRSQLRSLWSEALAAGDSDQAQQCDDALAGNLHALAECAAVIGCAQACDDASIRQCSYCGQRVTGDCCERHPLADVEEL